MSAFISRYLEDPGKERFYSSPLGGLSDNLMTIGSFAGSFVSCDACGRTGTLAHAPWVCACGQAFEVKPEAAVPGSREVRFRARPMRKPGVRKPHWFYDDENWSVAEFVSQILRVSPERFLPDWLGQLAVQVPAGAALESVLTWPRLVFGRRGTATIQPDLVIAFDRAVVLFEFKRPSGAVLPEHEVAGQVAFARLVGGDLGIPVYNVFVPGPEGSRYMRSAESLAATAREAQAGARAKWQYGEDLQRRVEGMSVDELAATIRTVSWERVIAAACGAIESIRSGSWSERRVLAALHGFVADRQACGLDLSRIGVGGIHQEW